MKKIIFKFCNSEGNQTINQEYITPDEDALEVSLTLLINFTKMIKVIPPADYLQRVMDYKNYLLGSQLIDRLQWSDRQFRNDLLFSFIEAEMVRLNEFDLGKRKLSLSIQEIQQTAKLTPGATIGTPWIE
jgi:hypothetical protein